MFAHCVKGIGEFMGFILTVPKQVLSPLCTFKLLTACIRFFHPFFAVLF